MSIKIDLKIFLFAILFWITKQIKLYAILMIFAFLHELGHLVCGLALDLKPNSFKVTPFGFQIAFKTSPEDYNKRLKKGTKLCIKRMLIALAGPILNILISFICLLFFRQFGDMAENIIYANLLLVIFNLLPIYPLDGGRVLKEIIHIFKGKNMAYKITNTVAKACIILLTACTSIVILYIHNIAIVIILIYLWYLVIQNEKRYQIRRKIYEKIVVPVDK